MKFFSEVEAESNSLKFKYYFTLNYLLCISIYRIMVLDKIGYLSVFTGTCS